MKTARQDLIRRSPRYPFVDVGKAIDRARGLWTTAGTNDVSLAAAWKSWGYGANSSGGIQTEAALKQFGLVEVMGRGKERRLKLSPLAIQIMESAPNTAQNARSIEKAALLPTIHRHLWERWRADLPEGEAQNYLIERGFQRKGAEALVAEYKRTMSFLASVVSAPKSIGRGLLQHPAASGDDRASSSEFVDLRFEGDQLILSARLDRRGIPNLIKLLRANQELIGGTSKAKNSLKASRTRKPK
jgi:hypothetical protein